MSASRHGSSSASRWPRCFSMSCNGSVQVQVTHCRSTLVLSGLAVSTASTTLHEHATPPISYNWQTDTNCSPTDKEHAQPSPTGCSLSRCIHCSKDWQAQEMGGSCRSESTSTASFCKLSMMPEQQAGQVILCRPRPLRSAAQIDC